MIWEEMLQNGCGGAESFAVPVGLKAATIVALISKPDSPMIKLATALV
jgi:hypothetical protein